MSENCDGHDSFELGILQINLFSVHYELIINFSTAVDENLNYLYVI